MSVKSKSGFMIFHQRFFSSMTETDGLFGHGFLQKEKGI